MGLIRNLFRGFGIILPILPYIFLIITLTLGGTLAYKKITNYIKPIFSEFISLQSTIESLADEQRRVISGVEEYIITTGDKYTEIDKRLVVREEILRARDLAFQGRFESLQSIDSGITDLERLNNELELRYFDGELELSIYEYVEANEETVY
jgi:hypothetical protein